MKLTIPSTAIIDTDELTQEQRKALIVQTLGYDRIRTTLHARQGDLFPGKLLWEHTLRRLAAPTNDWLS